MMSGTSDNILFLFSIPTPLKVDFMHVLPIGYNREAQPWQ